MPSNRNTTGLKVMKRMVQSGAPADTAGTGWIFDYWKSDGLYFKNESGVEIKVGNAADAVILAPASSARNTVQPTGDYIPVVIKGHASQTQNLLALRTSADVDKFTVGFDGKTTIARGTTTSPVASLDASETYAPTSGAGSDIAKILNLDFTDDRRTANLSNQILRLGYTRSSTATNEGSSSDILLALSSTINASLTFLRGVKVEGPTVASTKTLADYTGIEITDGSGAGAITTQVGLRINNLIKGSANYAIYTEAGLVRFGDQLSVVGSADRIQAIFKANGTQTTNLIELQNSSGAVQLAIAGNGRDFVLDATTGSKIGTAASQKLALWGATPVVQHSTTGQTAGFTAGAGTGVNDASTFTGGVGATAYTIGDVVRALKNMGAMAA